MLIRVRSRLLRGIGVLLLVRHLLIGIHIGVHKGRHRRGGHSLADKRFHFAAERGNLSAYTFRGVVGYLRTKHIKAFFLVFGSFVLRLKRGKGNGGFCGHSCVVINKLNVGIKAHAAGHFFNKSKKEGGELFALNSVFLCFLYRNVNGSVCHGLRHFIFLGNGVAHKNSAVNAKVMLCLYGCGKLFGSIYAIVNAKAAFTAVKCGKLVRAVAKYRHAFGFKVFKGKTYIKN